MPKCTIDGKEVEFEAGENLVEVAKKVGVDIPIYCYHPGLSVVAQCRMCTVEVEKMPKLQTACSTATADGMVVHTQSDRVKQNREAVMEFLLINHPLDCPICDQSGECDLQDFSYEHGGAYQRTTEERRTFLDLDMGPVIQKNMNRCIHCTRCIRFGDEVAGVREMVALQRGNKTEITTLNGRALETDYAGNYADICPTGSLTLKPFRFNKRVWMLKKTSSICEGCSKGCSIELHHDAGVIHRTLPRENLEINRYWICDEGRFNFEYTQREDRIVEPRFKGAAVNWDQALDQVKSSLTGKKLSVLIGSDLTLEEMKLAQEVLPKNFDVKEILHFGTPGITSSGEDGDEDQLLRRKSKTSNLNGAEKLGLKGTDKVPSGAEHVLVLRGGRAVLPDLNGVPAVGIGVFFEEDQKQLDWILPGVSFSEKSGTIVNHQGTEQKLERAVAPPRGCKNLAELFMIWSHRGQGAA